MSGREKGSHCKCPTHALMRGPFCLQEDANLRLLVDKMGAKNWSSIAAHMKGRTSKSCRLRCGEGMLLMGQHPQDCMVASYLSTGQPLAPLTTFLTPKLSGKHHAMYVIVSMHAASTVMA